ncbi:MAG TPA: class I SAM-dependent methyltransferase [Thermoanaerobaculia bacterium]
MFWRRKQPTHWKQIYGWFQWRSGQEEAVQHFDDGSRFVEVGVFLGRSVCSLGELVQQSGKRLFVVGIDTCRGSGIEGRKQKDFHAVWVKKGGGTFAGTLHRNVVHCGLADTVSLLISDSVRAASFFADRSLAWVHLDARHDRESLIADIAAWLPKVRSGGWLTGDDYDHEKWPEVVATIDETLPHARPWSVKQWRLIVE